VQELKGNKAPPCFVPYWCWLCYSTCWAQSVHHMLLCSWELAGFWRLIKYQNISWPFLLHIFRIRYLYTSLSRI
jgi:hypothetical protein